MESYLNFNFKSGVSLEAPVPSWADPHANEDPYAYRPTEEPFAANPCSEGTGRVLNLSTPMKSLNLPSPANLQEGKKRSVFGGLNLPPPKRASPSDD